MNPEKIKKKIENNRSLNENQKQLLISGLEAGIEETDIIKNDKIQNTENLSLEFNLTNEKFNLSKKKSTKSVTNSKVQKNLLDINNQTHNNNNNNNLNSDQTLELKQINYSPSNILNSNNSSDLLNSNNSSNISTSNISETSLKGCTLTTCGHTCLLCHPTLQQLLLICQKSQIISHPDLFSCIKNLLPIVAENGIEKFENYIKEIDNLWLKELILLICCTFGNIEFCQVLLKHNVSFKSSKTNLIQGEPALFFAAGNGKYSMVEWMLKNGSDVNEKKKDSLNTSLHFAAHNGHITVVELLINSGSQINLKNLDQLTPLSCASHSGQLETVKLLVKKGADIYIQDSFEELAIHKAVANDHTSIVEFLLTQDLKKDAKIMKLFGDSLFRKAIYHGNVLVSKILIKFGAEINFKSPKNISPLHLAVFKGNYLCAKLLIEEGANLEMECDSGMTALFFAAVNGHLECTKLLLENGANPNARDCEGKTTLHTVARKGNLNLTHLLISHNARPDLSDDLGWTPLHEATSENRPDCLKLLLEFLKSKSENSNKFNENFQENGTEKNNSSEKKDTEKNAEEETQSNRQSIQNTFFQEILNKHDKEMCTALHLASRCGNLECLKILVDYGAEIDCVDESLWTPLHEAVNEGYVECVRILLENGARPDAQDIDGNNALHRSAENGYLECAQLIVQYGPLSILYTKNEIGFTPSDLAVLSQSDECVSFLKQKIVEAKDKLEKLALERQEQLLQEEKKQQVEFQKQKQHWKKKEKRLKKKQRDKEKKQRQDRQIEESTTQKMNFLTKDALNIFDEEESNSHCSKKYEEEKNDQKEEFQSDDFFNLQLNQFELNIKNQTQNNNNKNNNNATNINNNKTSNNTNNNNITNNNINKNESKDYLLNQNETIKISNDDNYQNQMNNYQNQMNNYQNQMNNYQNQIQDLNAKLKSLNSNNIILRLQLEAAQQSIINMEKDLEIEKQKNMKFEEKVKTKLLFLEENVTILEKKANLLQNKKNCILCQKTRREILCLPCLHFIFCNECANNLKINQSECPICKLIINSLLPVKYD